MQAVKPAKEIGGAKAAKELGIPEGTIHTWMKAVRAGKLDIGEGSHTPAGAMSLSEEITMLRRRGKEQDKEIRRLKEENEFLEKTGKNQRMIFLALKTEDGRIAGKTVPYCRMPGISRQGFCKYLTNKDRPWKQQGLADAVKEIVNEDECNDAYGRIRMYQALLLKQPEGAHIPSERTAYRVMDQTGLSRRPKRKPDGPAKADREAMKSGGLLKRDFHSDVPLEKCITDITEIPASSGKLYVSAIFDCFDLSVLGLAVETNMKADLCIHTLENALTAYPALEGAVIHSDRGTRYASGACRQTICQHHIHQSMNSAGGRCHDNARCESMRAGMKTELLYSRYDTKQMTVKELKVPIWRCFLSCWNNWRICSANGGLPPMIKRRQYYEALEPAA